MVFKTVLLCLPFFPRLPFHSHRRGDNANYISANNMKKCLLACRELIFKNGQEFSGGAFLASIFSIHFFARCQDPLLSKMTRSKARKKIVSWGNFFGVTFWHCCTWRLGEYFRENFIPHDGGRRIFLLPTGLPTVFFI